MGVFEGLPVSPQNSQLVEEVGCGGRIGTDDLWVMSLWLLCTLTGAGCSPSDETAGACR
jgi:hypothetical protein